MNFFWILFLFPLIFAEDDNFRTVHHTCLGDGKLQFQVNVTANDSVNDIFSTDLENNCSLSNNDFTGNGTELFPYKITVDISKHLNSVYKPCGAKVFNGSFKVEFAIRSLENFFLKHDHRYMIQCNPLTSVFIIRPAYKGLMKPHVVPMKMALVSSKNSLPFPNQRLKLGEKVKLRIEILKDNFAKRGRVTLCFVQTSGQNKNRHTFYNIRCPVHSFPVPIKFLTNKNNSLLIESTEFEAFKFNNNEKVEFICYVELCTEENDPYCLETDCVPNGTFMRYYTEMKTSIRTLLSDASNQGFSCRFQPMTTILILLTKFVCF